MKVLNFGSLNIDNVFSVSHFVRPGETLASGAFSRGAGGKGLNQSIALARAGVQVFHAGKIGPDGLFLTELLAQNGADVSLVEVSPEEFTGSAMIQVSESGENCIILYGGANQSISEENIKNAFEKFSVGDILLIQNEINNLDAIMRRAAEKGMKIFFNPAPMMESVFTLPLELVDTFIVNEIEGQMLARQCGDVMSGLRANYPGANILMTLGSRGAVYREKGTDEIHAFAAEKVEHVVDTTAAGDTFTGFFLAGLIGQKTVFESLKLAGKAAAYCIARPGAADSIPYYSDIV
jgi:ribokinase